ncbi:hypothetical protein GCM10010264_49130 [Streptomyces globisporus]|nr:hypothetical protein GCM10010264_49130 [Streptomyces globisporus]
MHAPYAAPRPEPKARPGLPRWAGGGRTAVSQFCYITASGQAPRGRSPGRKSANGSASRPNGRLWSLSPARTGAHGTDFPAGRAHAELFPGRNPACRTALRARAADRAAIRRTRRAVSYSVARATWSRLGR